MSRVSGFMRRILRLLPGSVLVLFAGQALAAAETEPRYGDRDQNCMIAEAGEWFNGAAKTNQLRRLEIESECQAGRIVIRIRAFTKCAPRDCKWGWTRARRNGLGQLEVTFSGFFGARSMLLSQMGDRMEAAIALEYHDPLQLDRFETVILTRE